MQEMAFRKLKIQTFSRGGPVPEFPQIEQTEQQLAVRTAPTCQRAQLHCQGIPGSFTHWITEANGNDLLNTIHNSKIAGASRIPNGPKILGKFHLPIYPLTTDFNKRFWIDTSINLFL